MKRALGIGLLLGSFAYVEALVVFLLGPPIGSASPPILWLQYWALLWSGVFGLAIDGDFTSPGEKRYLLTFALVGLLVLYGLGAVTIAAAFRRFRYVGATVVFLAWFSLHGFLYLLTVRAFASSLLPWRG
jgi:hypothetical protein